jgi:hypothetical protein
MMKKTILVFALTLVFGLTFSVVESKAQHTMGPELKGPAYGVSSVTISPSKALDKKEAKTEFENYIKSQNNPNLRLGRIEEDGHFFRADILDQDNSLVDIIQIDKKTGSMRSVC